ncbi:MAG: hypothetical protein ACSHW0_18365 [Thalassotalea sp.]
MKPPFKKIFFVQRDLNKWKEKVDFTDIDALEHSLDILDTAPDGWIYQTYVLLKKRGFNVDISDHFIADEICIAHYDNLHTSPPANSYAVAVRGDRDRSFICSFELIQSPSGKEYNKNIYVPHWPQLNLIPRESNRCNKIERIGYFGEKKYLPQRFQSESFNLALKSLGVELVVRDTFEQWSDYSNIDAVLAVRDGNPYYLASKPVSKLVNAWLAGCPALLGKEPIFNHYRQSALDFIEVDTAEDVLDAIYRLQNDSLLYENMRINGLKRAIEVDHDAVATNWITVINEEIIPDYNLWLKKPDIVKKLTLFSQQLRKKIRGHLYDVGLNHETGKAEDRTSLLRKIIWFLFDRFAWTEYKKRKMYFKTKV